MLLSSLAQELFDTLTRSEVDDDVYEEYRVRKAVEGYPPGAQIIIEKTNGDWQNN